MRALLLVALLLTGCASYPPRVELSREAVVIPVQGLKQEAEMACGLTCLQALLRFYGTDLDEEGRVRFAKERLARERVSAGEIRDYLRGRGFRAHLVHGTLNEVPPTGLLALLRDGYPAIVELVTSKSRHFALACGFDREKCVVILMDPAHGRLSGLDYAKFEELWSKSENLVLAVAPPEVTSPTR
jgi:ABC-type bacteriocin/lantibiotic exporter with double-glycine peptidase domain